MEIYLAKHMEVDEDCSTNECPTDRFVPLEFGVYYLICIIKVILLTPSLLSNPLEHCHCIENIFV